MLGDMGVKMGLFILKSAESVPGSFDVTLETVGAQLMDFEPTG